MNNNKEIWDQMKKLKINKSKFIIPRMLLKKISQQQR